MYDTHKISQVEILIRQERYQDAGEHLTELLKQDPNNIYYLSLMADVCCSLKQYEESIRFIDSAISIEPNESYLFYTKGRISYIQNKYDIAEENLHKAIYFDPQDADAYVLLASIQLDQKKYSKALEFVNTALKNDSENIMGLNVRSKVLLKLNKSEESFQTIEGALREDPNNAYTHANYGWNLLENGNHKKALEHFKTSLQLDPSFDYAKAGIMEALKASNLFYRGYLKYSFWIDNLSRNYQWGVIIGFYLTTRFLSSLADKFPVIAPFVTPLIVTFAILAFSTWVFTPISNLFLRFNVYGKHLLSREEKLSSNFVAISLSVFLLGIVSFLFTNYAVLFAIAVYGFIMMIPFSSMFYPSKYNVFFYYAIGMGITGLIAIILTVTQQNLLNGATIVCLAGLVLYQFIVNYVNVQKSNPS